MEFGIEGSGGNGPGKLEALSGRVGVAGSGLIVGTCESSPGYLVVLWEGELCVEKGLGGFSFLNRKIDLLLGIAIVLEYRNVFFF